jgi:hypothetical protein
MNKKRAYDALSGILSVAILGLLLTGDCLAQATKGVDLRGNIAAFNIPVRDQGGRNTCSVHATTFLLEYESAKGSAQKGLSYSEEYLNAVTDIVKGSKDDGDFFNNILGGYLKYGTVDEADFPNTPVYDPNKVPSEALLNDGKQNVKFVPVFIRANPGGDNPWGLTAEHIAQIIAQLDAGRPVAAGWRLGGIGIETTKVLGKDVWSKNLMANAKDIAGHSMAIVGYAKDVATGDGYFIFRNTAGPAWGDKGYWYCTFDFARQNIADVFYFKPRPRALAIQIPQFIKSPVPRYVRVDQLRRIQNIRRPVAISTSPNN